MYRSPVLSRRQDRVYVNKANLNFVGDASYTLAISDAYLTEVLTNSGSGQTVVIPASDDVNFPLGIGIPVTQIGAGVTTIDPADGVTLNGGTASFTVDGQWESVILTKIGTDAWMIRGAASVVV